ncbi:MAG: thioredoxin [Conexivisphaerales archaeon]
MDELEAIKLKMLREMMRSAKSEESKVDISPLILTDQNFSTELQKNPRLVVDFWAEWCQPCRMMAPILDRLASRLAGQVRFGKLNVDENPITAQSYSVMAIPTLVLFRNGAVVDRVVGLLPEVQLGARIKNVLLN